MRKIRKQAHTILIICEGENTEPSYFQGIKDKILEEAIWTEGVAITILPEPKTAEIIDEKPSKYKTERKKRTIEGEKEEIKGVPPLKYIQKGIQALENFTEVWAIFDHDNHPARKEAFELAENEEIDGKKVQIAFSSIAFELWVLMHFEQCATVFEKSECRKTEKRAGRKDKHIHLECNSGQHAEDCYGTKCIGGYLRNKGYLSESTKNKSSLFPVLEKNLATAFTNAAWLRQQVMHENKPIYELKTYTDVDKLVAYLLKI
jgi:RloB-like protein